MAGVSLLGMRPLSWGGSREPPGAPERPVSAWSRDAVTGRWNSWGATAPLWGSGILLVVIGLVLIAVALGQVRRG